MDRSLQDVRQAMRRLRATPGFTLIAIGTLALGIGANAALFSVVEETILRPLDLPLSERLMAVWHRDLDSGTKGRVTPGNFADWREKASGFEAMTALSTRSVLLGEDLERTSITRLEAAGDFFDVVGVEPWLGRRWISREEAVVVISYNLWTKWGGDRELVGREVAVDGVPHVVIGVMPEGFDWGFDEAADLWAPVAWPESFRRNRDEYFLRVVGRLTEGTAPSVAADELEGVMAGLREAFPKENEGLGVALEPLHEAVVQSLRAPLVAAMGAVLMVLLIGCVNLSSLLLARAEDRDREIGVRRALGASTMQLLRLSLAESFLLVATGGAIGLGMAALLYARISRWLPPEIPALDTMSLGRPAIVLVAVLVVVIGLFFGILPALRLPRLESLRSRGSSTRQGFRGSVVWIGLVVALSAALLYGTGLLVRTTRALLDEDAGFETQCLTAVSLRALSLESARRPQVFERLVARVGEEPGVRAASLALNAPLAGDWNSAWLNRPKNPPHDGGAPPWITYRSVLPGYADVLGLRMVSGRFIGDDDAIRGGSGGVVINRAAAERFWPGADPLEERITIGPGDGFFPAMPIVGVVEDGRNVELRSPGRPMVYFHFGVAPFWDRQTLLLRMDAGRRNVPIERLRELAREIHADLAIVSSRSYEEITAGAVARPRTLSRLVGAMAAVGLGLAALGIFGTLSILVTRRRRELGIRMALGADPGRTGRWVVLQALSPVGVGLVCGLLGAGWLGRYLADLFYGVGFADPAAVVGAASALVVVAGLAIWRPIRCAMRVDPALVLRAE